MVGAVSRAFRQGYILTLLRRNSSASSITSIIKEHMWNRARNFGAVRQHQLVRFYQFVKCFSRLQRLKEGNNVKRVAQPDVYHRDDMRAIPR